MSVILSDSSSSFVHGRKVALTVGSKVGSVEGKEVGYIVAGENEGRTVGKAVVGFSVSKVHDEQSFASGPVQHWHEKWHFPQSHCESFRYSRSEQALTHIFVRAHIM